MAPTPEPLARLVPTGPFRNPGRLARYGSAAVITTLATILAYLIWQILGSTISPLFFLAVIFVSWYGGLRPGLLSALLSAAACNFILAQAPRTLALAPDDLLRFVGFMIGAVFVSSLTMARRQAEEAALDAAKQLTITLKSTGDAVIATDAGGRVTFMNA